MTIIPVEQLDQNDLDLLGDNVTGAIRGTAQVNGYRYARVIGYHLG